MSIVAPRTLLGLLIALAAAISAFLLHDGLESALVVMVASAAAVLVAVSGSDEIEGEPEKIAVPPSPDGEPSIEELIEALFEPVLIVSDNRVGGANRAARALLGRHILGQDVRLAIRHPAAAERLLHAGDVNAAGPIHLVGLGTRDQRWEMRVRDIGNRRLVHLIDRTGSYAAERMRVDFVANASHELRTPLASLLGFIETLGDEAGEDKPVRDRFLKIMQDEAKRMQRLVDDLISLSRIEAEKYRQPSKSVDLGMLMEEVRAELASTDGVRGPDIITRIEDIPQVVGDRAQLSQLLHNIAGNAMKYGRAGTPVTVSIRPEGEMVQIAVSDEGDGIAPEHLPRLTERFYRVDSGRSRAAGGTGLGLAIVKHIVERHRGRLEITSVVGKGTKVTVLLPAEDVVIKP